MKANVLYSVGDLRYVETDLPKIKDDEVLVKVHACGICGSDVARVFTTGTYHFPTIIGHEFSGEVVQVANNEDKILLGARAAIFPLIPCRECNSCIHETYETCSNYNYLGSRCDGGFAEYVAVPKWNLQILPDNVSYEEAAMLEPASVALHALRRSGLKAGDTVAIIGPGTIGMIMCQLAKVMGANKILLVGRSQHKLQFAVDHNFVEHTCNSNTDSIDSIVKSMTEVGFDIVIEGTGASTSLETCLNIVRPMGKICVMGNPVGDVILQKQVYWKLLRKQVQIVGTWNSSYGVKNSDWDIIVNLLSAKKLSISPLITHRFPMEDLRKGLQMMVSGEIYTNKVMIINE